MQKLLHTGHFHYKFYKMVRAQKCQDQFKGFYGMTKFAVNNASSHVMNYVIFDIQ